MLSRAADAYGKLVHDHLRGLTRAEVIERDDGWFATSAGGLARGRVLAITAVDRRLGPFDTVVMFGNNFGLFGGLRRARWLLRRFHALTSPAARILAESRHPYQGAEPDHRRYHALNRRRGRLAGQLRLRVRCVLEKT